MQLTDKIYQIKELIDRDCFELWQAKECHSRIGVSYPYGLYQTDKCYGCLRNYDLSKRIAELE